MWQVEMYFNDDPDNPESECIPGEGEIIQAKSVGTLIRHLERNRDRLVLAEVKYIV